MRNFAIIVICCIVPVLLFGCHNTRSLVSESVGDGALDPSRIKIEAPNPSIAHQIKRNLLYKLSNYAEKLQDYTVIVKIQRESDVAAFSEKEVVKEQVRLVASVDILDKNKNTVVKEIIDSFSTYEVSDIAPFTSISSKIATINSLNNNISNAIATIILAFLNRPLSKLVKN